VLTNGRAIRNQMGTGQRVLITGGTGFVGVRARARVPRGRLHGSGASPARTSRRDNLAGLEIELVEGDIRDACRRCARDGGVPLSGPTRCRLPSLELAIRRQSSAPTWKERATVMQAAVAAGLERVVYTSSVATLAPRPDGDAADETARLAEEAANRCL
jgi:dihydroflavonol-4-reductase